MLYRPAAPVLSMLECSKPWYSVSPLLYVPSLGDLIQSNGFKFHLYINDFQKYISSPDVFSKLLIYTTLTRYALSYYMSKTQHSIFPQNLFFTTEWIATPLFQLFTPKIRTYLGSFSYTLYLASCQEILSSLP